MRSRRAVLIFALLALVIGGASLLMMIDGAAPSTSGPSVTASDPITDEPELAATASESTVDREAAKGGGTTDAAARHRSVDASQFLTVIDAQSDEAIPGATVIVRRRAKPPREIRILFPIRARRSTRRWEQIHEATTDQDGRTKIAPLAPHFEYAISVTATGFVDYADIRKVEPDAGSGSQDIVIPLFHAASLTVQVIDRDSRPLERARVRVRRRSQLDIFANEQQRALTDHTGHVNFDGLAGGTHFVEVFGPASRKGSEWGRLATFDARTRSEISLALVTESIDLEAGQHVRRTIRLPQLTKLRIRVLRHGRPVVDGRVGLHAVGKRRELPPNALERLTRGGRAHAISASKSLDANGEVVFTRIKGGERIVEVQVGDLRHPHYYEIDVAGALAEEVKILAIQSGRLVVNIDGSEEGLRDAAFELRHEKQLSGKRIAVKGRREFVIPDLGPGVYDVMLTGPGILQLPPRKITIVAGGDTRVELAIPKAVPVKLRVRGPDGQPRVAIVRWRRDAESAGSKLYLRGGEGEIELAAGTWLLDARRVPGPESFGPVRRVEIKAGFPRDIELRSK